MPKLKEGWLAEDMKRASERVASGFSDWNDAIEAAAVEAENYPRTSSVGKPLSGIAIAAVIRKLKR